VLRNAPLRLVAEVIGGVPMVRPHWIRVGVICNQGAAADRVLNKLLSGA
jgi:hypothetical protein